MRISKQEPADIAERNSKILKCEEDEKKEKKTSKKIGKKIKKSN